MYDVNVGSEVLEAIAAFVAIGVAVLLVLAGPLGWVFLVVLGGALILIYGALREGPSEQRGANRVNCPACGSRMPRTEITCEYCGEELRTDWRRERSDRRPADDRPRAARSISPWPHIHVL